ncbi:N-acetylmuramoyl-L-alanine amidase [Streptomyces sp. MBT97]|uniref:peptidoglycan-binding protein n=1 Tax=Streptomyces sp. MBT97 TaxID=2800411 RepID=UPI00190AA666|nr:peptidoglycan-binding protein [Streptomyces sp. MBT97]MBK3631628.1 N-acetylmuramoyl-L-alanine amidase [Streptomyces sp. MBT97]
MKLVSRAAWGARPSKYDLAYIASTLGVKVHYEGTYVPKSLAAADAHGSCAGRMRDIQASHLANAKEDYSDIAYNAVVCPHGAVFEGRGLHRRTGANGNQTLNAQDYAVCAMVGSSGLVLPTDAQLDGIVDAIQWLRNGGDAGDRVRGHRDGYATSCPGDPLYAWVQAGAPRPDGTAPQGGSGGEATGGTVARYQVEINGLKYGYGASGAHVTAVGETLVARGFGKHYKEGPGPRWTDADTENFSDFQVSLGYKGTAPHQDADGVPGPVSLHELLGSLPGKQTSSSAVPPFPGRSAFVVGKSNPAVTVLDRGLVRKGFAKFHDGNGYQPGPRFTEFTRRNVQAFQRSVPALAADADGFPGPETWRRLLS